MLLLFCFRSFAKTGCTEAQPAAEYSIVKNHLCIGGKSFRKTAKISIISTWDFYPFRQNTAVSRKTFRVCSLEPTPIMKIFLWLRFRGSRPQRSENLYSDVFTVCGSESGIPTKRPWFKIPGAERIRAAENLQIYLFFSDEPTPDKDISNEFS